MLLEDTHSIDISTIPNKGKLALSIIDAGLTNEQSERESLLIQKGEAYRRYLSEQSPTEDALAEDYPNIERKNVSIVIHHKTPPTTDMLKLDAVVLSESNIRIPVYFKSLDESKLTDAQRSELVAKRNKKWWQFWI